jgi:pimeloyl-ACP methyl ester carboxylesterase
MEQISIPVGTFTFDALAAGASDGDLVLCLHGFPESAYEWRDVLPDIAAAGYRVVAPNQRGYSPGARPLGVEQYHITHLDQDVLDIADALGARSFHLVGHDWGALVAWHVAAHHAARVRTLTIVSVPHPTPFAAARASDPDQRRRSEYIGSFREPEAPERLFLDNDAAVLRLALSEAAPAIADEHIRVLSAPGAMTAALNYYRAWDDALDSVGPVDVPTLFVWSTDDVALGRVAAEATEDWVTGPYRFEVLDGVSHWIPEVAPTVLSRLILEHLGT